MKILSNKVALASWLLLLQATGIHASCFPIKNFRSPKTKQQQQQQQKNQPTITQMSEAHLNRYEH